MTLGCSGNSGVMLTYIGVELLLVLFPPIYARQLQHPFYRNLGHHSEALLGFRPTQTHSISPEGSISFQALKPTAADDNVHLILAQATLISRPVSSTEFQRDRWRSQQERQSERLEWREEEVLGPNITNIHTLAQLARMSANAYAIPGEKNWWELDDRWNYSAPIGWEPDDDGFRGHVFTTPDNSTVILSIKGTSPLGPTSKKDKFNDNLLFSCCCARVDPSWIFNTVCDCYAGSSRCDIACLEDALREESLFYSVGINLYNNLTAMYPRSNIWLVGHSLGGGLASLLSATFGSPSVAFESPGERIASQRLHLPTPPSVPHAITHVYHNADPVPQGVCTGRFSLCSRGGYALETSCHLGKSIIFDTVGELKWKVELRKHAIRSVIEGVLDHDWEVPPAVAEDDCIDCFKWEFGDFKKKNDSSPEELSHCT